MGRLNTSSCYFLPQRYSRSDGDDTYNCRPIIVCRLPHWPTSSTTSTVARRPPLAVHAYDIFYREWVQHFHPRQQ